MKETLFFKLIFLQILFYEMVKAGKIPAHETEAEKPKLRNRNGSTVIDCAKTP